MKKILSIVLFFFLTTFCQAQTNYPEGIVQADSLKGFGKIDGKTLIFIDSSNSMSLEDVSRAAFRPLNNFSKRDKIPASLISKTFYLRFKLQNSASSQKAFFYFPGRLYKNLALYKLVPGRPIEKINTGFISDGFIPLQIQPGQTNDYVVKGRFFKSGFNKVESSLILEAHIRLFKNELYQALNYKKTAGIVLSGMLLMMIMVTLLNYFITKKIEFLYNSIYSLCMFLLIFLTSYLTMNPGWFKGLFMSYLDLLLLIIGTVSYLAFTRHFLNTKELHPKLNTFLKIETRVMIGLMVIFSIIHFGMESYGIEIHLENIMKILLLLAGLVYIFLSFVQKNPLMNYLATGVATQLFFSIISLVFVLSNSDSESVYTSPIFYFEIGIIFSIIFFLLGLFYKNRQELILTIKEQEAMKLEVERQSFENRLTVYKTQQEERNRISADMHDDLGAGMTSIRLYSELAKAKVGDQIIPEMEKISSSADDLINKMNAIIWSMSSQNDSLDNMVAYIRSYTIEYLDGTGIKPYITLPENLPRLKINGTIRRNVFLVIKEALQNIVKHSNATQVAIKMETEPHGFSLTIHDNGRGIDFGNLRQFSNGLKNMKKRMTDVGIDFSIENKQGTLVKLYGKTR
ncbi:MAG: hypothetical protein H7X88_03630 [Gloeobacteraceae cyanobacterium ES-bin-316]|nr:hypothetical protein [Ferruginibacter sp.]